MLVVDPAAAEDMDVDAGLAQDFNSERLTANALSLQKKLDELRQQLTQLGAQKKALNIIDGATNHFYKETASDELHKLTEERTKTFLSFTSVTAALRSSQANELLTEALQLKKCDDLLLEPEEQAYVKELLEEERELSQDLLANQEVGTQQEISIIEARTELAGLLCRYQELRNQAGPVLFLEEDTKDKGVEVLQKSMQHEDARLNQMRMMIQKLMIGEDKFGMRFDAETNAKFQRMLKRCGKKPEEFRLEGAGDMS